MGGEEACLLIAFELVLQMESARLDACLQGNYNARG